MLLQIAGAVVVGVVGWTFRTIKPPPPKICGSLGGPPVTSPRVRLSDGRHLAYREAGVPKEEAQYTIIVLHGFGDSKESDLPVSQELVEKLRIHLLYYDRPGYGDSDPNPNRSVKCEAFDIQELADNLQISKFYVFGPSMGGCGSWSVLKYIPNRLLGVALVVPFVNYHWRSIPADLAKEDFKRLPVQDQWTFEVAYYAPWLFNWWMSQKWLPTAKLSELNWDVFTSKDKEILKKLAENPKRGGREKNKQQGLYVSVYQDIMMGHAKWEFDPVNVKNPFPNNEGIVSMWLGCEDKIIPLRTNRYIAKKLPWIRYHEVPGHGHLIFLETTVCDAIVKEMLLGEAPRIV